MSSNESKVTEEKGEEKKTVLIIGGGGREHAIAVMLAESDKVGKVIGVPGNGGFVSQDTTGKIQNLKIDVSKHDDVVKACKDNNVSLVFVGPEAPLAVGIADSLQDAGIKCFGPSMKAAHIEASKAWSKDFMGRYNIPTADYKNFTSPEEALAYLDTVKYQVVLKASGLAAGKGVLIPDTIEEAKEAVRTLMVDQQFGDAGSEIVIEERLDGEECSVLAFCDGKDVYCMPAAQDHKRLLDGDKGLNTGGMGAYCPTPAMPRGSKFEAWVEEHVVQATIDGMRKEGRPFVGVLFTGIMFDSKKGPQVLEFNCRMGDPETQVVLPLLDQKSCSLYDIMLACVDGELASKKPSIHFEDRHSATVVMASPGYPGKYPKGLTITGTTTANNMEGVIVSHAGTATSPNGELVTSGGRVLAVTGTAASLQQALDKAYAGIAEIHFEGSQHRTDIGGRALAREPNANIYGRRITIGVLGSTRGTSMQAVIDAAAKKDFSVGIVLSNRSKAGILEKARKHNLPAKFVSMKTSEGKATREEYDAMMSEQLIKHKVDLVLLIGYMRIVSKSFVDQWAGKLINVHPSLLPAFAGGMDTDVHQAVIDAKVKETGCTIHFVEEGVDSGDILMQKSCTVESDETADTLKAKVQALEGAAFVEVIEQFYQGKLQPKAQKAVKL